MSVDVAVVERTMQALLAREERAIIYRDEPSRSDLTVSPALAASRSGLLPALLVAGEAVWREATGNGFALDIARDPDAFLGYRLQAINAGSFTTVMLAMMEAAAQIAQPSAIMVNDLNALWSAASARIAPATPPSAEMPQRPGRAPSP